MGRSPFDINALMREAYQYLFAVRGNCSAPRFGALVLAGLDMALWELGNGLFEVRSLPTKRADSR